MFRSVLKLTPAIALSVIALLFCGCRTSPSPHEQASRPLQPTPDTDYQIYLIIDDAGQRLSQIQPFLELPVPMTIAVLPGLPATQSSAAAIQLQSDSKQLILHQPMQPMRSTADPGPGAIYSDTPLEEIPNILRQNLAEVPAARGMNNHMGSLITQDRSKMNAVMAFCKTNDLFFVDSVTTPASIATQAALEHGVPTAQQHVFLDNDRSEEAITRQFERGMRIAKDKGFVVMIGHASSPETARVIGLMHQPAKDANYSFHMIDDLL
ncbi:divergent polysaccharide deacetylase family protein [Tichowtungia aerotolerans]|uniref:Divergent polysaccharide deacetylase family protein n=1 Tax=Tichowtungia aerotolerans TaxID=2697043 RepID=A0A6P1M7Z6_9BACT|nr:divergent polysaccharide deacetylase family protein [Tichowtungia aerotolerans]QHI70710.1 divergent polysaccharide deacetylase family protein [Tichowtungia aerotolerans]